MKRSLLTQPLYIFFSLLIIQAKSQSVPVLKTNSTKVYVHYMPWFTAPENPGSGVTNYPYGVTGVNNEWGAHWSNVNSNTANPNSFTTVTDYTGAQVQTRNICAHYHPLIGPYDGKDTAVLQYHLLLMKLSGIDGVMIDWYGQNGTNGDVTPLLINSNALIAQMPNVGLKFGLVMEDNFWGNAANTIPITTYAVPNGNYAITNYFNNPQYIKLGDMRAPADTVNQNAPLVCVFGPQHFKTPGQWNTILQGNTAAFLPLFNQSYSIGTDAGGEFVWPYPQAGQTGIPPAWYSNTLNYYSGNGTTIHNKSSHNVVLGTAYQGFNDFYGTNGADADGIIPRNYGPSGNTLTTLFTLDSTYKSSMDGIQIATWNDFSEGTIIEPTVEFGFASLDSIQKFTGVPYTEADLYQVYRFFMLRKQYVGNDTVESELNQVFYYFNQLQIDSAKSLMDCITNANGQTICIPIPIISSIDSVTDTVEFSFNYQIAASNNPTNYAAGNLPAGLTINTTTGLISGTVHAIGTYSINITATNSFGTGSQILKLTILQSSTEIPYGGTPAIIPGIIQAENYDDGGQGIAYNDSDPTNDGGQYRLLEGVDIETCTDTGGGYDVGWTVAGEWIKYTVNVTQAGAYTLKARIASGLATGGNKFHILFGNLNLGTIIVPATGGWQSWQSIYITTPVLPVGTQILEIAEDDGGYNINYLQFTLNAPTTPVISSSLSDTGITGSSFTYSIIASNSPVSYNATGLPAGLSINTTTGIISGTPTATGLSNVSISASNVSGTGYTTLAIVINLAVPAISSDTIATDTLGLPFNYTIIASNTPTNYGATGLPAGLTLNTSTGIISGTPTVTGDYNVIITATNATGTDSEALAIIIVPIPVITSMNTAQGKEGYLFSYNIIAFNNPIIYTAINLPPGLTIDTSTGIINGIPTMYGTFISTISAVNGTGNNSSTLTITIDSTPAVLYISVNATLQTNETVAIQWMVDSEISIKQYEIERSSDSINFTTIYTDTSIGNKNIDSVIYNAVDPNPSSGLSYYRIKGISFYDNGKLYYSDIVKVEKISKTGIYPNPLSGNTVYIPFDTKIGSAYTLRLVNASGQIVFTKPIVVDAGSLIYNLQLNKKPAAGCYQLQLINTAGIKSVYKLLIENK